MKNNYHHYLVTYLFWFVRHKALRKYLPVEQWFRCWTENQDI